MRRLQHRGGVAEYKVVIPTGMLCDGGLGRAAHRMSSWPRAGEQTRPRDPRRAAARGLAQGERDPQRPRAAEEEPGNRQRADQRHPRDAARVREDPDNLMISARPAQARSGARRPPACTLPDQPLEDRGRPQRPPAQGADRPLVTLKHSLPFATSDACRSLLELRQQPSPSGETGPDPRSTAAGGLLERQRLKSRQESAPWRHS